MGLYQRSVLKNYLSALDESKVNTAYNEFKTFFFNPVTQQNIRNSKEEQFQEGFLRELFVKIMGYTLNPDANYNLISEQKNVSDAKKADGAILIDGKVVGVIELKGTNTIDLGKIQQQAFYYLSSHPEAVYVITSNFEKLRFYIQKSNDYEEFNLFTLTLDEFKLLYLCTSLDSISFGLPLKIKQESLVKEDVITKQLYKDYSSFKSDLFSSLCDRNSHLDKLTLFKATQKLIDRFLFIFFCEDNNGLLPANSIGEIIKHWNKLREMDEYKPLYDIFKKYFEYINSGRAAAGDKREIFAYNGGLFAKDVLLDKLDIDDNVLYTHTQKLSAYDFISEVDVNILGHIFEHSLNDIEEIQAEIAGNVVDKSKTKRKKDGVFYTPKYITEYIVENTVGKLCTNKKAALEIDEDLFVTATTKAKREPLLTKLNAYKSYLLSITICDPACGSGAFLNQAYVFLQKEHQYVADLESKLFDAPMVISDVSADILENNLFGVDINEESVEIARLALWLRSAKKGRKLNNLSNNIKCGNSLIDDPEVAGDKAFNWENEFPQVFAKGGFDVVIGNPPYVTNSLGKNSESTLAMEMDYFKSKFGKIVEYKGNLFSLFIAKSKDIMKLNGLFSFIIPNSILFNSTFSNIREFILFKFNFIELVNLKYEPFVEANTGGCLIFLFANNNIYESTKILEFYNEQEFSLQKIIIKSFNYKDNISVTKGKFLTQIECVEIIKKCTSNTLELGNIIKFYQGIITGDNKKFLSNTMINHNYKPILRGADIQKYYYSFSDNYVLFDKEKLWSNTNEEIFETKPKLINRQTGSNLTVCYDDNGFYALDSTHSQVLINSNFDLKFILLLENSKLINFIYNFNVNEGGRAFAQVKTINLKNLPIKNINIELQVPFISQANKMMELHKFFYEKQSKFISRLKSNFTLENITNNIEKFYKHDFKSFVDELKKQKVVLSLKDQDEWEDYFNTYKQEINNIQAEIANTDKEIDQMVYELYGLTDDEIGVVENG